MREFATGATRNLADDKHDHEGFNSPLVDRSYGAFMHAKRTQADGKFRASDNWQLGIPLDDYIKSLLRHVLDLRLHHDGYGFLAVEGLEETLNAIRFNVNGYLHETLKKKQATDDEPIKCDCVWPAACSWCPQGAIPQADGQSQDLCGPMQGNPPSQRPFSLAEFLLSRSQLGAGGRTEAQPHIGLWPVGPERSPNCLCGNPGCLAGGR